MSNEIKLEVTGAKDFLQEVDKKKEISKLKTLVIQKPTIKGFEGKAAGKPYSLKNLATYTNGFNKELKNNIVKLTSKNKKLANSVKTACMAIIDKKFTRGWKGVKYFANRDIDGTITSSEYKNGYKSAVSDLKGKLSNKEINTGTTGDPRKEFFDDMRRKINEKLQNLNLINTVIDETFESMKSANKECDPAQLNKIEPEKLWIRYLTSPNQLYRYRTAALSEKKEIDKFSFAMQDGYREIYENLNMYLKERRKQFDDAIKIADEYTKTMSDIADDLNEIGNLYHSYDARVKSEEKKSRKKKPKDEK